MFIALAPLIWISLKIFLLDLLNSIISTKMTPLGLSSKKADFHQNTFMQCHDRIHLTINKTFSTHKSQS
jgi:hypothetical protein